MELLVVKGLTKISLTDCRHDRKQIIAFHQQLVCVAFLFIHVDYSTVYILVTLKITRRTEHLFS